MKHHCFSYTGGVREALFGDEYYHVMWAKRTGFAKVALQANVVSIFDSRYDTWKLQSEYKSAVCEEGLIGEKISN